VQNYSYYTVNVPTNLYRISKQKCTKQSQEMLTLMTLQGSLMLIPSTLGCSSH